MKPILVVQHTEVGAPGAVVSVLETLGRVVQVLRVVDGEAVPTDAEAFAGLVFMGGYMSAHDELPWIPQELALIRDADSRDVPVAGHCLGAQLVALALGGSVHKLARPEIGWCRIDAEPDETALDWWGDEAGRALQTFQWHGDTFEPPTSARRIASSPYCANQVFVLRDTHLLVQSHLEMTPALVELSMERNGEQLRRQNAQGNPAVSDYADLLEQLPDRCSRMHRLLERLYGRWIRSCA
jgi:GMP synthase-like glutamine amidotransferase